MDIIVAVICLKNNKNCQQSANSQGWYIWRIPATMSTKKAVDLIFFQESNPFFNPYQ